MDGQQPQQYAYPMVNNQGIQTYGIPANQPIVHQQQQQLSKKDKRRQQIYSRLAKLEEQFYNDKDFYYRESLVQLQYKLSTLHSGENPPYLQKVRDLEERRDNELVRLRLAEEYQVKFTEEQFKQEYEKAVEEKEQILNRIKERLHERILKRIKQLNADKVLMEKSPYSAPNRGVGSSSRFRGSGIDMGSESQDGGNGTGYTSESASSLFFPGERRSRRQTAKRYDHSNLSLNHNADDSYESATGTGTPGGGSLSSGGHARKKAKHSTGQSKNDSSADDGYSSARYLTDNQSLNEFLYGSEYVRKQEKANTRLSNKSYVPCSGLKPEEVNDDLNILRNSIAAIQSHKKSAK